jgi:hypothetical protein
VRLKVLQVLAPMFRCHSVSVPQCASVFMCHSVSVCFSATVCQCVSVPQCASVFMCHSVSVCFSATVCQCVSVPQHVSVFQCHSVSESLIWCGPLLWSDEELSDLLQVRLKSVTCPCWLCQRVSYVVGALLWSDEELSHLLQVRLKSVTRACWLRQRVAYILWGRCCCGATRSSATSCSAFEKRCKSVTSLER